MINISDWIKKWSLEAVPKCHSEALAEACPERSEGTNEILHYVQDDALASDSSRSLP